MIKRKLAKVPEKSTAVFSSIQNNGAMIQQGQNDDYLGDEVTISPAGKNAFFYKKQDANLSTKKDVVAENQQEESISQDLG